MNAEQKLLFDELTELQQRTATGVLAGMSQRAAYFAAGGTAKSDESADSTVATMLSNVKVVAFMDAMKLQAVSNAVMGRQEMLERLTLLGRKRVKDVVRFKTAEVGRDMETGQPLMQTAWEIPDSVLQDDEALSVIESLEVGKFGPKIKTYSSIQAMTLLAKLQGFEAPGKLELTGKDGQPIKTQEVKDLTDEELDEELAKHGIKR